LTDEELEKFEVDDDLQYGPKQDRICTDVLFYIIFLVFGAAMLGIAGYGFSKGNPEAIISPYDSKG
jgi:hypothetical protein